MLEKQPKPIIFKIIQIEAIFPLADLNMAPVLTLSLAVIWLVFRFVPLNCTFTPFSKTNGKYWIKNIFRLRQTSFYMPFPLTIFMLPPHFSKIVGCCVKILSTLKEFNTWFKGKREFLEKTSQRTLHNKQTTSILTSNQPCIPLNCTLVPYRTSFMPYYKR